MRKWAGCVAVKRYARRSIDYFTMFIQVRVYTRRPIFMVKLVRGA